MSIDCSTMKAVSSSNIEAVGYDDERRTLIVSFKPSGAIYAYDNVPPDVHADLIKAESVGKYFATHIKPKFSGVRVPANQARGPDSAMVA